MEQSVEAGECFAHGCAHARAHVCKPLNPSWQCRLQSPSPTPTVHSLGSHGSSGRAREVAAAPLRLAPPHLRYCHQEPLVSEPPGDCRYLETWPTGDGVLGWGQHCVQDDETGLEGAPGAPPRVGVSEPLGPEGSRWS